MLFHRYEKFFFLHVKYEDNFENVFMNFFWFHSASQPFFFFNIIFEICPNISGAEGKQGNVELSMIELILEARWVKYLTVKT